MSNSYEEKEMNACVQSNIPDGEYLAIITDVKIKYNVCNYIVEFCYVYCDNGSLQNGIYEFNHIFTNKRGLFQEFCEKLELFDEQTCKLDFSKALGVYCVVDYNTQAYKLTIRPADDSDIKKEKNINIFDSVYIPDSIKDVPKMIENYYYFPYCNKEEIPYNTHFGCITGYKFYTDKDNSEDETLCLDTVIFNGGYPRRFQYYLNKINIDCNDKFFEFCEKFGILGDNNEIYLDDALFIPCSVELYKAKSNKIYVSEIAPISVENKYHQKQLHLICYAYKNYLNSEMYDIFAFDEL